MLRSVWAASAAACLIAGPVRAETVQLNVAHDKATVLRPLFSIAWRSCGIYPVGNIRIDAQPAHGQVTVVEKPVPLPKSFAHCAGKVARVKWLVYQPRAGFKGNDTFSYSYTHAHNTLEISQVYISGRYELKIE